MVVLDQDGVLGLEDLPRTLRPADLPAVQVATRQAEPEAVGGNAAAAAGREGYRLAGRSLQEVERDLIAQTLELVEGNRQRAAEMLGMGERTLYRKIKEYGL